MKRTIILGLLAFLLYAASSSASDWDTFPLYPEAQGVKEFTLFEGQAHEIFFTIEAPYPFSGVIDHYNKHISDPWIPCASRSEGWSAFGDVSGKTHRFVHQYIHYWANFNKQRLLSLSIKYYSSGAEYRKKPDNNTQRIILIEYKHQDVHDALKWLSIECEKNT